MIKIFELYKKKLHYVIQYIKIIYKYFFSFSFLSIYLIYNKNLFCKMNIKKMKN